MLRELNSRESEQRGKRRDRPDLRYGFCALRLISSPDSTRQLETSVSFLLNNSSVLHTG